MKNKFPTGWEGLDKVQLARQLSGIWRNRKDLKEIDHFIRRLRKRTRLEQTRIRSSR